MVGKLFFDGIELIIFFGRMVGKLFFDGIELIIIWYSPSFA